MPDPTKNKALDLLSRGGTVAVPVLGAVILLYSALSVEQTRNDDQERELELHRNKIDQLAANDSEIRSEIGGLRVSLSRLEVLLESVDCKLTEVRDRIDRMPEGRPE